MKRIIPLVVYISLFFIGVEISATEKKVEAYIIKPLIEDKLNKYNLNADFIEDIISWESGFATNVISVFPSARGRDRKTRERNKVVLNSACDFFKTYLKDTSVSCMKNGIRLYPSNMYEILVSDVFLSNSELNYDAGLMQINKVNVKALNLSLSTLLVDLSLNIDTGVKLLKQCYGAMGYDSKKAIECYNKGTNSKVYGDYGYYARILELNIKRTGEYN